MFACEFCEISKNTFFTEHLWTTGSGKNCLNLLPLLAKHNALELSVSLSYAKLFQNIGEFGKKYFTGYQTTNAIQLFFAMKGNGLLDSYFFTITLGSDCLELWCGVVAFKTILTQQYYKNTSRFQTRALNEIRRICRL